MKVLVHLLAMWTILGLSAPKVTKNSCSNNCYLGGTFFSEPLDHNRCCSPDKKDPHCEYYAPMLNSMVCFRCQLGYQWDNNQCVEFGQVKVSKEGELTLKIRIKTNRQSRRMNTALIQK